MKQQDIKTEEKFMSQNIWLSISTAMVCLLLSVYSLIKHDNEGLLFVGLGVSFYVVIVIIYLIKGCLLITSLTQEILLNRSLPGWLVT